jgi:small-conductance mechanosensitive channel
MNIQTGGIVVAVLAGAWLANWVIDLVIPRLARVLAHYSERVEVEKVFALRRLETFVGIGAAVARLLIAALAMYLIWRLVMPTTAPIALLGASAFFAIVAGSTLGPLLRDVTSGTLMIAERWYNVGDHITVEPFMNVSGVVEQLTPRSTQLRSLSGEVVWMHNQHVQAVRVMKRGVRTIALDVFVTDLEDGKRVIEQAIQALPTDPTMVARQMRIHETEKLGEGLWRITASGQTTHGREWLIEDFAVKAILKYDALREAGPVIAHGPIASYTDATAVRRFGRMIRAKE